MHLFLAPHPDDAVMSCGGQIYQLTRQRQRVMILTVMAGDPPKHLHPTAFTRELEVRWEVAATPFAVRRDEDAEAAVKVSAGVRFLDNADAPYRCDAEGNAYYPDWQAVISTYHQADDALIERLIADIGRFNWQTLHAPLAAGNHVDHRIVREAALRIAADGGNVQLYEDYPYAVQDVKSVKVAQADLAKRGIVLREIRHQIDNAVIDAKIAAIACYRTQISTFWKNIEGMAAAVRTYTAEHGELEWQISEQGSKD